MFRVRHRVCLLYASSVSDKARYGNFVGRDGAARSGLKMGGRGRQRAPLLLILGQIVPLRARHFREHATISPEGMPWIYPDYRYFGGLGFERESAGEVWYAGRDKDGRWHLCSEGNPHA